MALCLSLGNSDLRRRFMLVAEVCNGAMMVLQVGHHCMGADRAQIGLPTGER
jgi:hypothetical protein